MPYTLKGATPFPSFPQRRLLHLLVHVGYVPHLPFRAAPSSPAPRIRRRCPTRSPGSHTLTSPAAHSAPRGPCAAR
eukprot:361453-Chlamydomonas_euryale.AAC.4